MVDLVFFLAVGRWGGACRYSHLPPVARLERFGRCGAPRPVCRVDRGHRDPFRA